MDVSVAAPQVAGAFYPADRLGVSAALAAARAGARSVEGLAPKMIVAPHAGFAFSGAVAASAYALLAPRRGDIRRVVILGPAHRVALKGMALHPAVAFETPLGRLAVDWAGARRLLPLADVRIDAAPFAGEHSIETQLPFIQSLLGDVAILPVLVGECAPDVVAAALARVWGGPETAIVISSDLSHFLPHDQARATDARTRQGIETLDLGAAAPHAACGHRALAGALGLARALDLRATGVDLRTSADTTGRTPERTVGYGAFAFEYAASARLGETDRALLLDTAGAALRHAVETKGAAPRLKVDGRLSPSLTALRATFVTLEIGGRLRGCIGSLAPSRSLLLDVAVNAVKAGFGDPRFPPLSEADLERLTLSVSILSHPRPLAVSSEAEAAAELSPDRDGVMLADGPKSALFLPSVWRSLPDPCAFLAALKRKAGLDPAHWSDAMTLKRFSAESFGGPMTAAAAGGVVRDGLLRLAA
jgi:hypothetical protein